MKNKKSIIIISLLSVITLMAVGYASFATELSIRGTAEITGVWDIKITNVEVQRVSEGCNAGTPEFTNTTVRLNAELNKPGDSITYVVTIQNAGTIDAVLDFTEFRNGTGGKSPITFYRSGPGDNLNAGETTTMTITVVYGVGTTDEPAVKTESYYGFIEYVQK